jgi:hypothetical protein
LKTPGKKIRGFFKYNLYQKLVRLKRLDMLKGLERTHHQFNLEALKEEIAKYEYLSDFTQKSHRFYLQAHRHKLQHLYMHLKRKR